MLLNRTKSKLEASMENAIFKIEEIPQVVESFLLSQKEISQGRLENLVSNLNQLQGTAFKDSFREEDFRDVIFMTNENILAPYASAVGLYPYAVGFIFPHFESIATKLLHRPKELRGFYVNKNFFRQRPFSDTGVIFIDRNQLEATFIHYHELTISSQWQYAKTHQLDQFIGQKELLLAYELELALLREITSVFVQNKEFSRFQGVDLGPAWHGFWESLKKEFTANYLPTYRKMTQQLGYSISENLEEELKRKIDIACEVIKSLLNKDSRSIVNIFFRFGTVPEDMNAGKLYSPLNDVVVYFK